MTEITAARLAEMKDELARYQKMVLEHLESFERGEPPQPPKWSMEEQKAWSEALTRT